MSPSGRLRSVPAGGGRLAARYVALDAGHHLAPGEIVWDGQGRIVSLRRARGRVDDVCVLPGLVNAHVHLQIAELADARLAGTGLAGTGLAGTGLAGAPCDVAPGDAVPCAANGNPSATRAFVPWLQAVLGARVGESAAERQRTARSSIARLTAAGTTAVGEIDSSGDSLSILSRSRLAGRCYRELTGFHLDPTAAAALVAERYARRALQFARGLSPHAPYSVSAALFRVAAGASLHLAVHCAEAPEEQQFLHTGQGPFAELLARLGRLPAGFRAPGVGAVRWLERLGVLRSNTQLVHCQELERGDVARIAAAGASIVVCPGTIEWFQRDPPPVERWLAAGLEVAMGTDSQASNRSFSMPAELAAATRLWPTLSPAQLLTMATASGGAALAHRGLGRLRRGGRADLFAVPAASSFGETLAGFVHGDRSPCLTVCRGRRIRSSPDLRD